jgi:hypothetical protein
MARKPKRCKCKNCEEYFILDHRNVGRQVYCGKPQCRKASKAASQEKWLKKPENRNYFRGQDNVERVRQWRKKNPGYWRKKNPEKPDALQDSLNAETSLNQSVEPVIDQPPKDALQELLPVQEVVLIGLIAQLTGCALQDDIASVVRRLRHLGQDILNCSRQPKGENHVEQTPRMPEAGPPGPQAVQLGGPPAGPRAPN